jgi:hypothetical protein
LHSTPSYKALSFFSSFFVWTTSKSISMLSSRMLLMNSPTFFFFFFFLTTEFFFLLGYSCKITLSICWTANIKSSPSFLSNSSFIFSSLTAFYSIDKCSSCSIVAKLSSMMARKRFKSMKFPMNIQLTKYKMFITKLVPLFIAS